MWIHVLIVPIFLCSWVISCIVAPMPNMYYFHNTIIEVPVSIGHFVLILTHITLGLPQKLARIHFKNTTYILCEEKMYVNKKTNHHSCTCLCYSGHQRRPNICTENHLLQILIFVCSFPKLLAPQILDLFLHENLSRINNGFHEYDLLGFLHVWVVLQLPWVSVDSILFNDNNSIRTIALCFISSRGTITS